MPWSTTGVLATPSNVTRITRALNARSDDGKIPQVVFYQGGLGSRNDWYSYFVGGYLGDGIAENIREAYAFLSNVRIGSQSVNCDRTDFCQNYEDGDEIILIGFSRGGFTARSIGGLIGAIGLLTRKGLENFYSIFRDWENQMNPDYKPEYGTPELKIDRKTFGQNPNYAKDLAEVCQDCCERRCRGLCLRGFSALGWLDQIVNPDQGHWGVGYSWNAWCAAGPSSWVHAVFKVADTVLVHQCGGAR